MNGLEITHNFSGELTMLAVHWFTLWLALYLLTRRPLLLPGVLIGAGFAAVSAYFLSLAYYLSPEILGGRWFWGVTLSSIVSFAPVLLLHALLVLTGSRLPWRRVILGIFYVAAALVFAGGYTNLIYADLDPVVRGASNFTPYGAGPLYLVEAAEVVGALLLCLFVTARAWRSALVTTSLRRQLGWMTLGVGLMLAGAAMMFVNAYLLGWIAADLWQVLPLLAGCALLAVTLCRFTGTLEGQLLRRDLQSLLLGAVVLMAVFAALAVAADGSFLILATLGFLLLLVYMAADELRSLTDRVSFSSALRAGRASLRRSSAYVGASARLDIDTLLPSQAAGVIEYMSDLDRAGAAAAELERRGDPWLTLLGRDEFAAVREALGLPKGWRCEDGLDQAAANEAATETLAPRERQALGLSYLGYSSKEIAVWFGVKDGVPQSYISDARRKLGLSAGAQTRLYVHFSGVVESDALPLMMPTRPRAGTATEFAAQTRRAVSADNSSSGD